MAMRKELRVRHHLTRLILHQATHHAGIALALLDDGESEPAAAAMSPQEVAERADDAELAQGPQVAVVVRQVLDRPRGVDERLEGRGRGALPRAVLLLRRRRELLGRPGQRGEEHGDELHVEEEGVVRGRPRGLKGRPERRGLARPDRPPVTARDARRAALGALVDGALEHLGRREEVVVDRGGDSGQEADSGGHEQVLGR